MVFLHWLTQCNPLPVSVLLAAVPRAARLRAPRVLPYSLAIGLLAFAWDRTAGCSFATGDAKMAKARVRLVTRGRSFWQLLIIATSVVLWFLYPTLNKRDNDDEQVLHVHREHHRPRRRQRC